MGYGGFEKATFMGTLENASNPMRLSKMPFGCIGKCHHILWEGVEISHYSNSHPQFQMKLTLYQCQRSTK